MMTTTTTLMMDEWIDELMGDDDKTMTTTNIKDDNFSVAYIEVNNLCMHYQQHICLCLM